MGCEMIHPATTSLLSQDEVMEINFNVCRSTDQ